MGQVWKFWVDTPRLFEKTAIIVLPGMLVEEKVTFLFPDVAGFGFDALYML